MVELPAEAVRPAAQKMLEQYASEYDASHLDWTAFERDAREVLAEALPVIVAAVRADLAGDVYELRELGVHVLGEEQCCELACNGGACESCPCCCAGWCVWGHSGTIPDRDLTPHSHYRIWLDTAAEHNPVAKLLAQIEGTAGLEFDEPVPVAAVRAEERQASRARIAAQIEEAYSVEGAMESDDCTYAVEIARGDHGDWEPGTLPGSRYVPVEAARSEASQ